MSDFWFNTQSEGIENDNPWASMFAPSSQQAVASPFTKPEKAPQERTFFDRLFAPFEAPQQTLFALSTGHGLWDSLSHGAVYFNPWSNEERIDPEEVRQAFFGDMADSWVKGASNLAISLLFDPLMIAPISKVAGASGRALQTIEKVTNPAQVVFDVAKVAARDVVGPLSKTAYARVFGEEAVSKLDNTYTAFMGNFINRFHGVDPALQEVVVRAENLQANFYGEGTRVIKGMNALSPRGADLISEAMERQDVFFSRTASPKLTSQMAQTAQEFDQKLLKEGVHPDIFWPVYDRTRKLDDEFGDWLVDNGLISTAERADMEGTHFRRIYGAHENPLVYADRIEALNVPDSVRINADLLRKRMSSVRDSVFDAIGPLGTQPALFADPAVAARTTRYFDNAGKIHAKNFTDDFVDYLNRSTDTSLDEVFTHVKDEMLGGIDLPGEFYATLGNYMSGVIHFQEGSAAMAKNIRENGMRAIMGSNTPSFVFKPFRENLDAVKARKDIPDWAREVLDEIVAPQPRIASTVKEVGGLVAARHLFSTVSGTKRLSADAFEQLQHAKSIGFGAQEAKDIVSKVAGDLGVSIDDLAKDMDNILEKGAGTVIGSRGSAWASETRTATHIRQIPQDPAYGDLAGMWVDTPTFTLMRGSDARDTLRSQEGRMLSSLGDMYRDGVGVFKFMKAVADPTAQMRNFFGGAILANMAGFGFDAIKYVPKMINEMKSFIQKGDFGYYMKLADDAGVNLWKQDLASVELKELSTRVLDDSLKDLFASDRNTLKPFSAILHALDRYVTRKVPGVRKTAEKATGFVGATAMDAVSHNFSYGDQFWKLGVFMKEYDNLASSWARQGKALTKEVQNNFARQAASLAQQSLFNYADVPWGINMMRKWGVVPFATFPFKAVPFVAKTLYDAPWRVLRYERLADGINNMMVDSPNDLAQEIDNLPEYLRDRMVLKLPWKDGQNRDQFLDLSYYVPWEALRSVVDTAEFSSGGFREGMARPPVISLIDALWNNRDTLGRPIVDASEGADQLQNFEKVANYVTAFMLPSWVPGASRAASVGRSMMASATTSPEPQKWKERLGLLMRSPTGGIIEALGGESAVRDSTFGRNGALPQANAQVTREGWSALWGIPTTLFGGATASQPQAIAPPKPRKTPSEIARASAAIRSNPKLSLQEKAEQIRKLRE